MSYIDIDDNNGNLNADLCFKMAQQCSKLLNYGLPGDLENAREIIINMLNKFDGIPDECRAIWIDLTEAAGFYPYINIDNFVGENFLSDRARYYHFQSKFLQKKALHIEQKRISDKLFSGKNLVLSAPTSFGKSLLIEELVASGKYKNIVVIQPTLALLDETRIKLKKYSQQYKIIVRTSQNVSDDTKGNLFLLTAERVMEYQNLPEIDLFVLDEFYKLSLKRTDDRANILNNAFLKVMGKGSPQFYLLGPNIGGLTDGFVEKYKAEFYKTDFSMVASKKVDLSDQFNHTLSMKKLDKEKQPKLFELLDRLSNEQTIIYCASPARVRKMAREYYLHVKTSDAQPHSDLPLIKWIEENISSDWSLVESLKYGIAIHDGSLQKHISSSIISYFNTKRIKYIFCTSTIIEGVNTSAKNVVIYDSKKGSNDIDYFDYSNICGRSGRMMEHYIGNIYSFIKTPQQEEFIVDIPFIEQDKDILTDEILINIPNKDVKPQVKERYKAFESYPNELRTILKQNGININGQMKIYYAIKKDINTKANLITWTKMPTYEQMEYILNLSNGVLFNFDKHGVHSVRQLVTLLSKYREGKSLMVLVNHYKLYILSQRKRSPTEAQLMADNDRAIEEVFHIYRHWFQFKVPKAFRVVDSIQRYVCKIYGKKAGSYSYYVQQLENDFVPERLSILIEYGIPNSTISKIEKYIPQELKEEDIISFIKSKKFFWQGILSEYEMERLNEEVLE